MKKKKIMKIPYPEKEKQKIKSVVAFRRLFSRI